MSVYSILFRVRICSLYHLTKETRTRPKALASIPVRSELSSRGDFQLLRNVSYRIDQLMIYRSYKMRICYSRKEPISYMTCHHINHELVDSVRTSWSSWKSPRDLRNRHLNYVFALLTVFMCDDVGLFYFSTFNDSFYCSYMYLAIFIFDLMYIRSFIHSF